METEAEQRVWKALGDPTRRRILELLRNGPQTTGTLCDAFDMSRYGVMKHLDQLTDAGLIRIEREGRSRFNHLNPLPLQRIHERFVHRFAARSATQLLSLEKYLEGANDSDTQKMETQMTSPNLSFHLTQELNLNAPLEKVWDALTTNIHQWWGFHVGPKDSAITLEGRIGGLFIERWGDGEGELYGTVTYLKKHSKLTLEGSLGMAGPGFSKYSYAVEADGDKTKLTLTHDCHGHRTEEVEGNYREGWTQLMKNITQWCEEGITCEPM